MVAKGTCEQQPPRNLQAPQALAPAPLRHGDRGQQIMAGVQTAGEESHALTAKNGSRTWQEAGDEGRVECRGGPGARYRMEL